MPTKIRKHSAEYVAVEVGKHNGSLLSDHLALIQKLLVKQYHRSTCRWLLPYTELPFLFNSIRHDEEWDIDDEVRSRVSRLNFVVKNKHNGCLQLPPAARSLKTPSLKHQDRWLAFACNYKAVANLSEQGSGKSKMALDWFTVKGCSLVLIICKNSNCYKWAVEVNKHSDFTPFVLKGSRLARVEKLSLAARRYNIGTDVAVIINYDYLEPFMPYLTNIGWDGVCFDESTAIKNIRTKRFKAARKIVYDVKYRLILTGTPLVNAPLDAYGQLAVLNSEILGKNYQGFKLRYCIFGGYGGYEIKEYRNLDELAERISNFSFRVLKKDCLDLPPKTYDPRVLDQPSKFRQGYSDLVSATLLELGDRLVDNTIAITKLNRCLQYCDGFLYTDREKMEYTTHPTPKIDELFDFMDDHFLSSRKLVIWAYFRATIINLEKLIKERYPDLWVRSLMGGISPEIKHSVIQTFNDAPYLNDIKNYCIILQTSSNCHGIDVVCDTSFYYSRSFSNEEWQQSQDRNHGINRGIEGVSTTYVYPMIDNTVEMSVDAALEWKKSISDYILRDNVSLEDLMKGEVHAGISAQ